jgi:hypothetical protein
MAPGTWGKVGPLNAWRPQAAAAAGLRHLGFDCAIKTPPPEYGLAMLASSGKSDGEVEQVKRRISPADLRVAWRSSAPLTFPSPAPKDFSFLDLSAASFEAGRSKNCLGLCGPKPFRFGVFFLFRRCFVAHEIDQTMGRAAVFVIGEPAWHRLGTMIEHPRPGA